MKLFSKFSNACDHSPPTSQTDGQTDRETEHGNTALRYALRGKYVSGVFFLNTAYMYKRHYWCLLNPI